MGNGKDFGRKLTFQRFHGTSFLQFLFLLLDFRRVVSLDHGEFNGEVTIVLQWIVVEMHDLICNGWICMWIIRGHPRKGKSRGIS